MDEIIKQIKAQIEINFQNIKDQIEVADLEAVFDGVNGSRYIFHNLHSMDRFFINPAEYVYEGEKLFGIPENLSVISTAREGFVEDTSIVIPREKLMAYFEFVTNKIEHYLENLTAEELIQKPQGSEYTRLELILGQMRHAPEQEQDATGREQRRHRVDHAGNLCRIARKEGKQFAEQHEERRTGRVSHLHLLGSRNKLRTVPETGRRLDGRAVSERSDGKHQPSAHVVHNLVGSHS